ncbi:MAG: amidohydrolase [Chitinophagales bacterium]|jgi:aminocarboxymuconate-semialdehyde decarboxylase|nr:amidohydrolase [Chitinophagales bacterium]
MCHAHFHDSQAIDIHTHIIPEKMPNWAEKFGYGGFVSLDHYKSGCARMMIDNIFFREIMANCWSPEVRMSEMKNFLTDVQVLSTIPVMFNYHIAAQDCLALSQFLNDHIASIVSQYPKRFIGLGTVPMQDETLAVKEIERMKSIGIVGIQIGSNINDINLSEPQFDSIWAALEAHNMPVFIHPWNMMGKQHLSKYWLAWLVSMPAESSRAISSLIFSGVFERYPKLRFAFAHGGGSFPFTIGRIQHGFDSRPDLCAIDNPKPPRDYLGHFWVDSLVHHVEALNYNINLFGEEKIVIGSDYPFPLGELSPGNILAKAQLNQSVYEKIKKNNALSWLFGNF